MSLERFRALLPAGDRNFYLKNSDDRVELCTRTGYRAYAAWMTIGNQPGLHVRALAGVKSNGFRGRDHNWVYVAEVDWDALAGVLAESKRLATMRGGGRKSVAGVYCENCDIALVKTEGDDGVRPYAIDPAIAQRLWTWSERWL